MKNVYNNIEGIDHAYEEYPQQKLESFRVQNQYLSETFVIGISRIVENNNDSLYKKLIISLSLKLKEKKQAIGIKRRLL